METKNDILNELKEISPVLAAIGNRNVYTAPQGYFDSLADEIFLHINSEYLLQKNIITPFEVPANYFDTLANNILSKIKTENEVFAELNEIAPLLNTIGKKNIYTVPANYFENFYVDVNAAKPAQAKVVNMAGKTRKWLSYAAAAAISGVLITGAFLHIEHNNQQNAVNNTTDQNPYASISNLNVSEGISKLSDAEIADYLDKNSSSNEISAPPSSDGDLDVQDMLNNASDEEIQQYLDNTKTPVEKSPKGI